jgi:hypothetical protein
MIFIVSRSERVAPRLVGSLPNAPEEPLAAGGVVPLSEAVQRVDFALMMPHVAAANPSTVTKTWVDAEDEIAVQFDTLTLMMWPSTYTDVEKDLQAFMTTTTATAHAVTINGDPGVVVLPNTDTGADNPAWVEYVHNGLDINLYSRTWSLSDVLDAANSMRPWSPDTANAG